MTINVFKLEEYLSKHEFTAPYLLCCSDAQTWSLKEILAMANEEELLLWDTLNLGYTEVKGLPQLRQVVVENLYPHLTFEHILCFSGAEEGIFCSLFTLLNPQDHVIVITPCYQSLLEIPKIRGCTITTIDLKEENDWRIDLHAIKKAIRPNTKWVVINFPHNPTGQILTKEEQESLIELLDSHGIYLFSDEVYRLLGPSTTHWTEPLASLYPRALSLGVMSKAYGLAGLRIGWIACQNKGLLNQIEKMRHYTGICNSAPSEVISLIALRCQKAIVGRNNGIVDHNLQLLDEFFHNYGHLFSWVRPQGGCVGFVKYHGKESVDEFCESLLANTGVLLMPASLYDVTTPHFRIGFGRANMEQALEQLKEHVSC